MTGMSDDRQIHELLAETFGGQPPRPDFTQWRERHAQSVELLVSRARTGGRAVSPRLIPRMKDWIMNNKLKALGLSTGVAAAGAVIAWACWLSSAGDSSGAAVGPRDATQTAQSQPAPEAPKSPPGAAPAVASTSKDSKPAVAGPPQRAPLPGSSFRGRASRSGEMPLPVYLHGATLVMRGRVVEFTKEKFRFVPSKILFGRLEGAFADVYPYPSKEYSDSYMRYVPVDKDIILGLAEVHRPGEGWRFRANSVDWDRPKRPLDDREKAMRQVFASGTHLVPPGLAPDLVGRYITSSDRIVRAELTARIATKAEWRVEGVLHQLPGTKAATTPNAARPATMTIGLDPWRLRAEAIVRGRFPAAEPNPKLDEFAVQQEFQRLVRAELELGQKAILFVREPDGLGQSLFRRNADGDDDLVGILKGDPTRSLDDVAKTLREVLEAGAYKGRSW